MDATQVVTYLISAAFGAGGAWATLQGKVKQHAKDIEEIKETTQEQFKQIDAKLDRLNDHIIALVRMAKG